MRCSANLKFVSSFIAIHFLASSALALESYKDQLWSNKNRTVIESRLNGGYKRYRWNEMQDVNGRDAKPGLVAKPERIDKAAVKSQKDLKIKYQGGEIDTYQVGEPKDAKFAVIFIHGSGGDKNLGVNDEKFGGNFNRIKSLVTRNNGVYYSPSVELPTSKDQDMVELIKHIKKNSPQAKIMMVCGSAGARLCWSMADKKETVNQLSGLIFTGGAGTHPDFENSEAFKANLPIVISHGSKDPVVPVSSWERQFNEIKKADPKYPVRMEVFEGGKHGTPLRNIDYKETFEWVMSKAPENSVSTSSPSRPAATPASAK